MRKLFQDSLHAPRVAMALLLSGWVSSLAGCASSTAPAAEEVAAPAFQQGEAAEGAASPDGWEEVRTVTEAYCC